MAYAVVTRSAEDCAAYAPSLVALGLEVVAAPVTRTEPPPDRDALARALANGPFDLVLVASPRAAHELARVWPGRGADAPAIWAVGPATKRALESHGFAASQPDQPRDAAELANHLVATMSVRGKRVLVPRAEDGRTDAIDILRAAGAEVIDVIAYRTVADPSGAARGIELLRAGQAAVCIVFAPSQVAALAGIVGPLAQLATQFVAIGETTAAAMRAQAVTPAVAATPTPEGIAQAVRSVYPPRR